MNRRFLASISKYPALLALWDLEQKYYDINRVNHYLSVASHGQAIMLRFFLNVWRHKNEFGFDIAEAAAILDGPDLKVITDWMHDPYWP